MFAQEAPKATTVGDQPVEAVDVPLRKRAEISSRDMAKQATSILSGMKETLQHVVKQQEQAKKLRDVIKVNCVADKLLQIKQLVNIGESANTNLQEATAREDEESRYHEFGRITIAGQQVAVLRSEADNCIGVDLTFMGPTQVVVETPNEPEDPTLPSEPTFPVVEPPPVASPFV